MGMDALKDKLKELHSSLDGADVPDTELLQLLRMLDADIHGLLARQSGNASDTAGLVARARGISARFAAQHPRLEPVLRELTDMLARIGI